MTLTIYSHETHPQRSEQWHELRLGMVTASTVGALITSTLKVAANDTSRTLVDQLAAERILGFNADPSYQNLDMWRGETEEPRARERYAEVNAVKVEEIGFMVHQSDEGWSLGYSPDGIVGDDGLVEVKCPRAKTHLRTILSGEVPAQHMAQLQAGLFVSGREWIEYISWSGGMPMWTQRVSPQDEWFEAIENAVRACEGAIELALSDYKAVSAGLPSTERLELVVI